MGGWAYCYLSLHIVNLPVMLWLMLPSPNIRDVQRYKLKFHWTIELYSFDNDLQTTLSSRYALQGLD
ncbi:hypothetical protein BDV36DRAFT_211342 [Aspergillus pseudocaelatus]|uniref:Uncharacterized protein n=1 Tax=Aspergillus pseudocaelatus TaxID=1825620 RepID=A0ABQ6X1Z7_9EURO|nr:hypothetical protein BDV36DRAFT_211342 [Aspergillus pseudocaelatus]